MMHLVEVYVCVCVCLSVCTKTLKLLQISAFCLVVTYTAEKSRTTSHVKAIGRAVIFKELKRYTTSY